jgi:hypothetical protein
MIFKGAYTMKEDRILLEHGSGGMLMNSLIHDFFMPMFKNEYLDQMGDSAVVTIGKKKVCFTTDSYVVDPIFFPGGDIGSLSINGTVNDIAMCGGKPLFVSVGFIMEEGFPLGDLEKVVASMGHAANVAGSGSLPVTPRWCPRARPTRSLSIPQESGLWNIRPSSLPNPSRRAM